MKRTLILYLLMIAAVMTVVAQNHPLNIPGAETTRVGIYIEDLRNDTVIADINADDLYMPASVMKSVTSATALSTFDPEGFFTTAVTAVGDINDEGVLNGDIVVITIGDPTIESTHFKQAQGFADSIAAGVKRLGITRITGRVIIDESRFVDPTVPEGWLPGDLSAAYGTLVHGCNYRGNTTNGRAVHDPASWMRRDIHKALGVHHINIDGRDINPPSDAPEATVYVHVSPPIYDILHSLMIRSDNMFAEAVLRSLVEGRPRSAAIEYERDMWSKRGLDMDNIKIYDGSGLSRKDRLSPIWLASLYRWMYHSPMSRQYSDLFPRAGREGTMRNFLKGTRLEGRVAMKTGSVNKVQGYGGYMLDDDGNPTHIIVIFVNNFTCDRSRLRSAIANFLLRTLP